MVMKHVSASMIVSVVLSLLVVLWVKMSLNGFAKHMESAKPEEEEEDTDNDRAATPKPAVKKRGEEPAARREAVPAEEPVVHQPPPTQLRPAIPWDPQRPPPMPMGATLIQVEPDPMMEDESAFEHAE